MKKDIELDGALNQTSLRLRGMLVKLSFKEPAQAGKPAAESEAPSGMQETLEPIVDTAEAAKTPEGKD